jgi:TRAP-type C4-dicarboxylate transport system permease small subunit
MEEQKLARARRFLRSLYTLMAAISTSFYGILAVVLIYEIISRNLFDQSIYWASRVAVFAMIVGGNFGLALATAAGAHIRPRLGDNWIPKHWGRTMDRVSDIVAAVMMLAVGYFSALYSLESFDFDRHAETLPWPIWPVQAVIAFGYIVAAAHYFVFAAFPALRPAQEQMGE